MSRSSTHVNCENDYITAPGKLLKQIGGAIRTKHHTYALNGG